MTQSKDEYRIEGDNIIIPKKVLEGLRDYYQSIADANCDSDDPLGTYMFSYYSSSARRMNNLLKLFEPLEG